MNEVLETIALVVWIAVGVYAFFSFRQIRKRLDTVIATMERDVQDTWR